LQNPAPKPAAQIPAMISRALPICQIRRRAAFTLLEIILALAIALTLAAIAIPATGGWVEERNFRVEMEKIASWVMEQKMEAETRGEGRVLWLLDPEKADGGLQPAEALIYRVGGGFRLLSKNRQGRWESAGAIPLRIQAGGVVSPMLYRLERGDRYVIFRFDPLTGHLDEQEFSF
jgi:prepilin-type N-terminal cleavage/methylation domain-containing protein